MLSSDVDFAVVALEIEFECIRFNENIPTLWAAIRVLSLIGKSESGDASAGVGGNGLLGPLNVPSTSMI